MNDVNDVIRVLNTINYGFINNKGINIFDDLNVEFIFSKEYHLMSPEELLQKKYGVCWDQVELERKLFKNIKLPFNTYFIYINDNKNLPSHTFLVYEDNNKYCWFEHSWFDEKGIHEYDDINSLLNDVEDKFIKSHKDELTSDYETCIYEYDQPNYNITCDEFYKFIYNQKKIYNYKLKKTNNVDIDRLKQYKLNSIVDYATSLSDDELKKIDSYIQENVPKQLNKYKNIVYNNNIVGSVLIYKDDGGLLLDEIYLEKEYRNKGIGSSIIENIICNSNECIYLWVYKNNVNAYNLYLKIGFKIFDETETRYKMKYEIIN